MNKSQNKTLYELFNGRTPAIRFLKPFGCHVMILNTLDNLGKFEAKGDEGYFIGYSMSSKTFRVFNKRTRKVEENLHVELLENKAIEKYARPNWLFDIDSLTISMNYVPVDAAHDALLESSSSKPHDESSSQVPKGSGNPNPIVSSSNPPADQMESLTVESPIPTVSSPVLTACLNDSPEPSSDAILISKRVANQEETPSLETILSLTNRFEDILGVTTSSDETIRVEADMDVKSSFLYGTIYEEVYVMQPPGFQDPAFLAKNFMHAPVAWKLYDLSGVHHVIAKDKEIFMLVEKDYPLRRGLTLVMISYKLQIENYSQMAEDLIRKIYNIANTPRNKARLVAQGNTQEEGIDYDEVFAPVARTEAIRLFLDYASFMGFTVYQMDVKSAFLYGTMDEEVYVMQPLGFQDPAFPAKVYKVEKAMYGLHQAPRAWYGTLSKYLLNNGFQRGTIDQTLFIRRQRKDFILVQVYVDDIIFGLSNPQLCREFEALMHEKFQMSAMSELNFFLGLQVLQKEDDIFLSQDKYIGDILKKFRFSYVRSSNIPTDKKNP
nr:hypothetical protein [Tanacetum cinerariifolium]